MRKLFYTILLISPLCSAQYCNAPWEDVPSPTKSVKTCRLSVPHGWLVFNFVNSDVEIPTTLFYPDENHEWPLQN